MEKEWYLLPEDSVSLSFNEYTGGKVVHTIADLKAALSIAGFNSCLLISEVYGGTTGYSVIVFNVSDTIYIGDKNLQSADYPVIYFTVPYMRDFSQYMRYVFTTDGRLVNRTGTQYSYATEEVTIGGINYRKISSNLSTASFPACYITLYQGDIYINGELPPEYEWRCIPNIKGYSGQLDLAVIKENAINNGQPMTNANIDAFSNLPQSAFIPLQEALQKEFWTEENVKKLRFFKDEVSHTYYIQFFDYDENYSITSAFSYVTGDHIYDTYLAILVDDEQEAAKISVIYSNENKTLWGYNEETLGDASVPSHELWVWLQGAYDPQDVNEDTGDGESWTPRQPQSIGAPAKPQTSAINTGFTTMYLIKKTEESELRKLSSYMWSEDWIDIVKKWFDDPSEVIVALTMFPIEPDTYASTATEITAGGIQTDAKGHLIGDQYRDEKIGSLHIDTAGDNFLDYSPFTKAVACLPYCGEHSLDISNIMDKTLELHYLIDFFTGACVAYIIVDDGNGYHSCDYIFAGQMGNQIPISKTNYNNMISAIISSGVAIGGTIGSIATGGMTAPMAAGTANIIMNGMNMHPDVSFTSGGGGTSGMIASQEAYIRIEEPIPKKAKNQNNYLGKTAYLNRQLSSCSGYTKCLEVHLENIAFCPDESALTPIYYPATAGEIEKIYNELKTGVIIQTGSTLPDLTPTTQNDTVIWFTNTVSENNVIGKTFDTTGAKIEGKLLNNQSISSPKYIIENEDIRKYNYAYIPEMHRFYFIDDIILTNGNIYTVSMHCDVLNSFKDSILNCNAIVERQAHKTNRYFNDPMYWTQQNKNVVPLYFKTTGYNNASFQSYDDCYILTVAGS